VKILRVDGSSRTVALSVAPFAFKGKKDIHYILHDPGVEGSRVATASP